MFKVSGSISVKIILAFLGEKALAVETNVYYGMVTSSPRFKSIRMATYLERSLIVALNVLLIFGNSYKVYFT